MNAGIAAYVILTQNTDVTDIVGVNIFPEVAEQETATPFVVYQLLSVAPEDTHDGPSKLDEVRFEFLCYADSYALAADLGSKVRGALDRVSGTYNGVNVESVQFNDVDIDTIDAPRRFAQVLTFTFRIKRDNVEIAQGTPVTGAKLGDLYDVDTTGVTDGQVIAYDAAAQEWQPADDAGGVTELGQLTDVQFGQGGPETGELLKYDGSEWTNDTIVKSEIGLGNVDNTSDANKPVSTATQTELNAKANSADFSNVDNTSDADKPISTATQTALNAKADTSAVPTDLNDLSDVTIVGTPAGNQALIYDATAGAFKSLVSYTNRFEDEVENGKQMPTIFAERAYSVKAEGDGVFIDPESDTPAAGKVIVRKIYHKTGFITDADVIGDYTLIHTFADDTAYADTVATFEGFEDGATYGVPPFTLLQTWEEVTAAPAFTGLLNETYGSGAAAAYSTRRLNGNYSGACMTIRRTDGTTQAIGFVGEEIDESAITTFCTGSTCTVQTWHDQSQTGGTGSGNDATQSTPANQPTIYTGGALVKENGKLALDFDGTNDVLGNSLSLTNYDDTSIFTTIQPSNTPAADKRVVAWGSSTNSYPIYSPVQTPNAIAGTGTATFARQTSTQVNSTESRSAGFGLVTFEASSSGVTTFKNGVNSFTKNFTWQSYTLDQFTIGALKRATSTVDYYDGTLQEVVIYPTNRSTDRTSIEENIGDYFTQNTPLLDTYSGAAAAYSLRLLDSTYTGSAIRVRRSSDNTEQDIGFNVFGELDTVSLLAFAGTGDAFVKTWYSQTGSNDATQTATGSQPQIVSSGAVIVENGKPAVEFDGSSNYIPLVSGALPSNINNASGFAVYTRDATSGSSHTVYSLGVPNTRWYGSYLYNSDNKEYFSYGTSFTVNEIQQADTNQHIVTNIAGSTQGDARAFLDGTLAVTASLQSATPTAGAIGSSNSTGSNPMDGTIQEFIVYHSDQSANRTNIESNINTFYSIY